MKAEEYRKLIIDKYLQVTNANYWNISDDNFKMFCDMAKFTKSGKTVLENWGLYLKRDNPTVQGFIDWYAEEVLRDDREYTRKENKSPFSKVKAIWENDNK